MNGWLVTVELADRGGATRTVDAATVRSGDQDLVWIGRVQGNGVVIPRGNVSKRHCCLIVKPSGDVVIQDGTSTNGTWVDGRKLTSPLPFGLDDRLYLGDHVIRLVAPPVPRPGWRVTLAIGGRSGGEERIVTVETQLVADDHHEITLGRQADVVLDGNASRRHCALIVNDAGATWVRDLGSTNGTYLDGERIDTARFVVGQRLHVGRSVVRLVEPPVPPAGHVVG